VNRAAVVVRTANHLVAHSMAHHPLDEAVAAITAHLWSSWAPSMRADLVAHLDDGGLDRTPLAAAAAEQLGRVEVRP
jgi:formate dehydrogenase subunit delta